jgi:hypothetical protein
MTNFKLVTVYESQGMLRAHVIKGKLESAGLTVFLKYEALGQVLGLTVDGLGRVEVQVPEDVVADALELIAEPEDDEEDETAGGEGAEVQ